MTRTFHAHVSWAWKKFYNLWDLQPNSKRQVFKILLHEYQNTSEAIFLLRTSDNVICPGYKV